MDLLAAIEPDAVDLSGDWQLASADGEFAAPYAIPGDVHSALISAGVIPHPYPGTNELQVRWVADRDWVASREFQCQPQASARYFLDIDYLDTVAEIRVNGHLVLMADNCFRRYRPDVSAQLVAGTNTIEVTFRSNTKVANERQAAQPFPVPYIAWNSPIPNGNMLRKPACHFGWDWNLAIAPFGLYGRVRLERVDQFRIEHVVVHQKHLESGAVHVDVDVMLHGRGAAEIEVSFDGERKARLIEHSFGEAKQRFRFTVDVPRLWWPAGQGEQNLYELHVHCDGHSETRRIGLRQVELITTPDEAGTRFALSVNGQEIFCRGANWIPADALPSQATPELVRKLLQAARDANMNMLRVWGGGYYEQDCFYETCDELGLMVWQDFMFSCNLYPATPAFLKEVKAEADYQVKRLQHHAALVLWCGDNELIGALTWFKESKANRDRYLVSYDRLNRTIEDALRTVDPNAVWWPSSPSPGILDFGDAWHNDGRGDMHFWSVWHEGKSFDHYLDVKPRFCSEFGFQSFPSLHIAKRFVEDQDDLNISSAVMEHHQRNAGGNARIAETLFRYFRFPMDFGNFVYLSQVQHGLAMRTAVEYWRSLKPHCMGTLYWQLNDTWPVASWSGLDHGGGWKALHYMARRFFAPVLVTARRDKSNGNYIVSSVNDTSSSTKVAVVLFAIDMQGKRTDLRRVELDVPADRAIQIAVIDPRDMPAQSLLMWSWMSSEGTERLSHLMPENYKSMRLPAADYNMTCATEGHSLVIVITAQTLMLYVMAETSVAGHFSDNIIDLLPGDSVSLRFTPDDPRDLETARNDLVIRNLYSSSRGAS